MSPDGDEDKKILRVETEKQPKCLHCKLDCQFKGKDKGPKIGDLVSAPKECGYRMRLQETAGRLTTSLSQHVAAMNRTLANVQAIKLGGLIRAEFGAITELNKYYQQQMGTIAASAARLSEINRSLQLRPIFESYQYLQPQFELVRNAARLMSVSASLYFPSQEFKVLQKSIKIPKESAAMKLIERLIVCQKGKDGWTEFQILCKEILAYLFTPPLVEPVEQERTETGLHVRDLIMDIPYALTGFWGYIRDKFDSSALVVECKNYSSPVEGNQIVISSKYLGRNRLGRFGIVLSRSDPAESAHKETRRLWNEDEKMILCLKDDHLIKMLQLKETTKKPEIVIDNVIHEFLRSLE